MIDTETTSAIVPTKDETVGSRVRARRTAAGLTQGRAAIRVGLCRPTYIASEFGRRPFTAMELTDLAALFGCDVSALDPGCKGVADTASPLLDLSLAAKWVRLHDAGEISERRLANFLGTDRPTARTLIKLVRRFAHELNAFRSQATTTDGDSK